MDKRKYVTVFELMLQGMIEKERAKLENSLSKHAKLYHLTGKCESRRIYNRYFGQYFELL